MPGEPSVLHDAAGPLTVTSEHEPPGGEAVWLNNVAALEGGFFHTPAAIGLALPDGESVYLSWTAGQRIAGVAVGVTQRCRLGGRMHIRLATAPALAPDVDPARALARLAEVLESQGMVELQVPAFDGAGMLPITSGARPLAERIEYVVRLDRDEDAIAATFSATQRRYLRRAIRNDWTFSAASHEDASRLLYEVQRKAADRGAMRGNRFAARRLGLRETAALTPASSQSGATLFVAESRGELLAAALVGWSAKRAFYLRGGSTQLGYASNVAVWLHWRIMQMLRQAGVESYNLGGTPSRASEPDHAQHGLHRFKCDLGAEPVPCQGLYWPLRPVHLALHRAVTGIGQLYRGRASAHADTFAA